MTAVLEVVGVLVGLVGLVVGIAIVLETRQMRRERNWTERQRVREFYGSDSPVLRHGRPHTPQQAEDHD